MHSRILITACAAALAAPLAAQSPDTGANAILRVSRPQAVDLALAHNPTIAVAREQVAQARARVTQASAFPDFSLGVTFQGLTGKVIPEPAVETDIIAAVTVPFPHKFQLRGEAAEGDVGALNAAYTSQRQVIASQTVQAYDSLLVAMKHREDLQIAAGLARDFLKRTEARYTAGTTARLDVVKAQVAVAQAQNDLIANERGVANARSALNRLLGRTLGSALEPIDSLALVPVPDSLERLERIAREHRPELAGIEKQIAAAQSAEQLAQQYYLPDLNLSVQYNKPYFGVPNTFTTGIGITVPLMFWEHQNGEVAETKHRQLELNATRKDVAAQVDQEVRDAFASASTAYAQALFIRDQLLPSAEEQYRIASTTYGLGGSSALEVIDAQSTLLDAKNQYVTALGALSDAIAELERAVGAPLTTTPSDQKTHD